MSVLTMEKDTFVVEVGQTNGQTDPVNGTACAILPGQGITVREDGKGYLACANAGEVDLPCVGVSTTTAVLGSMLVCKRRGDVRDVTGINVGKRVYVSNTAGAFADSAGDVEQIVGFSDQCDEQFYFNPETVAPQHTAVS